jgi:hypothetical protein
MFLFPVSNRKRKVNRFHFPHPRAYGRNLPTGMMKKPHPDFLLHPRAPLATFRDQQVEVRSCIGSTLAFFPRKRGLVSVKSGSQKKFKDPYFKDPYKIKVSLYTKYFLSSAPYILT